jgi:hypothetical protein
MDMGKISGLLKEYHKYIDGHATNFYKTIASMSRKQVDPFLVGFFVKFYFGSLENFQHGFFGMRRGSVQLHREFGQTPNTIIKNASKLEKLGYITIISFGYKKGIANLYILNTIVNNNQEYIDTIKNNIGLFYEKKQTVCINNKEN